MLLCICFFIGVGCDKNDKLPSYQAKGTIIEITGGCYGEIVLIEVEEPQGIGLAGVFSVSGKHDEIITYQNAIGVPYFSKIGIPDSISQTIGTRLYFKYRELTDEEEEQSSLFSPDPPIVCPHIIGSPVARRLMITKVIRYE